MKVKEQVQEAINMGLTLQQTKSKLRNTPKGTVATYYYSLKKRSAKPTGVLNVPLVNTDPVQPKAYTKLELIDRIIDSDMVNHQKKVFVRMVSAL